MQCTPSNRTAVTSAGAAVAVSVGDLETPAARPGDHLFETARTTRGARASAGSVASAVTWASSGAERGGISRGGPDVSTVVAESPRAAFAAEQDSLAKPRVCEPAASVEAQVPSESPPANAADQEGGWALVCDETVKGKGSTGPSDRIGKWEPCSSGLRTSQSTGQSM